ncbi:MAG: glycosyltransferase family 2 protein, partial [Methylovulum sp.]
MKREKISIAIVTYNSEKVVRECIASLLAQVIDTAYELTVLVIDNKSQDATVDIVQGYAGENNTIKLIQNATNSGFGTAHNIAINQVDSGYHIICNPDIIINNETINALADYMERNPDIGILCPRFINPDGSLQANNHRNPTILDLALRRLAPVWLKKIVKHRMEAYIMLDVGYENICDVPFVSGAFMFCRTDVLKKVAGFDEYYFLYFEDADLCRKM